jgi:alpha-D-xyloside xylohydrolase
MFTKLESYYLQEGFQPISSISFSNQTQNGCRFRTMEGPLDVSFFSPGIVRFRFEVQPEPDYGILVSSPESTNINITPNNEKYILESNGLTLEIQTSPFKFRLLSGEETKVESSTDRLIIGPNRLHAFAHSDDEWFVSLALDSNEPIYGLGEKFGYLNHRGELITSWNQDSLGVSAEASYKNVPFAWSPKGWGIFIHTPARVIHGVGYSPWSHRSYIVKVEDYNLDIFFIIGDTPQEIIERYTHLTGRTSVPPVWGYGTWMARAFYRTADELLDVAKKLRNRRLPSEVILLDGRAWHKPETRFDFRWDPDRYSDPDAFVQTLKDMNFRLCLWEYPYISTLNPLFTELAEKGFLLRTKTGKPYIHKWLPEPFDTYMPHLMPSGIVDLTNPEAYQWYLEAHKTLFDIGVAVMKPDYGESIPEDTIAFNGDTGKRLHNVYSLLYNRCVFEATQKYGDGKAMVWGRSGWAGSQRYPIQWGGDPQCDWEGLVGSIHGALSWGMSGAPFYAHDIGGFAGDSLNAELYIRWTQTGVMSSHTRFHGTSPREPWEFGEDAEEIVREWLDWRYRLIPYLHDCAVEASQTGMPVMRAMPLVFPQEKTSWGFEEQYMLGPSLLVAPVTKSGGCVEVYLPKGGWYDIWTGERLQGPASINYQAPLNQLPIFGREGTILPLGPSIQHTDEIQQHPITDEVWAFGKITNDKYLEKYPYLKEIENHNLLNKYQHS